MGNSNDNTTDDNDVLIVESEQRVSEQGVGDADSPVQPGDLCDFAGQFVPGTELFEPAMASGELSTYFGQFQFSDFCIFETGLLPCTDRSSHHFPLSL